MGGRQIDTVLTDVNREELDEKYNQHIASLAANNHQWRHDRDKLKQAIHGIIMAS